MTENIRLVNISRNVPEPGTSRNPEPIKERPGTCETSDLLAKDKLLPNMEKNDLLAINDVISIPLPVETSDGRQVDCFI